MAFGLRCIGSERGLIPWMLADGRGVCVPAGDADALADALRAILSAPAAHEEGAAAAAGWAQQFSLESLREQLAELLTQQWQAPLSGGGQ
jgi:glycosyltransferase involved in cell wall biosynthesis